MFYIFKRISSIIGGVFVCDGVFVFLFADGMILDGLGWDNCGWGDCHWGYR